jgi:two-component system, chemotaxis family, CheB/CheR fusion protein
MWLHCWVASDEQHVDAQYAMLAIMAAAVDLLGIYGAPMGRDLIHLARTVPAAPLRAAIDAASRLSEFPPDSADSDTAVTVETVQGEWRQLQIACYPRLDPSATAAQTQRPATQRAARAAPSMAMKVPRVLILLSDGTPKVQEHQVAVEAAAQSPIARLRVETREPEAIERSYLATLEEVERLQAELEEVSAVNRRLLRANQELVDANLDLRGTNDELLMHLEEGAADTEEITTLNEELQATNEELATLNEEMEATVADLHAANDGLGARSRELEQLARHLEQ